MIGTLGREIISTRQEKLAEVARIEPNMALTTLAHHICLTPHQESPLPRRKPPPRCSVDLWDLIYIKQ